MPNNETMTDLERAETMIGDVELSENDKSRIGLYINHAKQAVMTLIGVDDFPQELNYIVDNVVVAKFNKFHNEGLASINEEGLNMVFIQDDLKPYYNQLQAWIDNKEQGSNGKAIGWE